MAGAPVCRDRRRGSVLRCPGTAGSKLGAARHFLAPGGVPECHHNLVWTAMERLPHTQGIQPITLGINGSTHGISRSSCIFPFSALQQISLAPPYSSSRHPLSLIPGPCNIPAISPHCTLLPWPDTLLILCSRTLHYLALASPCSSSVARNPQSFVPGPCNFLP